MDVFVSWTSEDCAIKDALVEKLTEAGLHCWVSDEKCVSDFSAECVQGIRNCGVFIVIVSDASMKRGYVKNEVTMARKLEDDGDLNILVYKATDSPYTDNFEFQLNHISFVTGNYFEKGNDFAKSSSGIDEIVRRTLFLLKKRKEGFPEKPFEVAVPKIEGLKITRPGYFVENSRDETMLLIDEALKISNVVVLKELFGYGKRSTVKKFAEFHRSEYDTIILVDNEADSLRDFIIAGLEFENINAKVFEKLEGDALIKEKFKQLEKLNERTMIVVPNIKLDLLPDPELCQRLLSLRCKFLIITQDAGKNYSDWFPVITLGKMKSEYLKELFFHYYTYATEEEQESLDPVLDRFFEGIGGHTKTIELTATVLSGDLGVHPEEVPEYLSLRGTDGMKLKDKIMHQQSYLLHLENLSEVETTILLVASYIAVPAVSEKVFRNVLRNCGVDSWEAVLSLDKRRWLDVDIRNRTVSIEPLIAKMITGSFPENYFIISKCIDGVYEWYYKSMTISSAPLLLSKNFLKLERFLSNIDFHEMAEIISCYRLSLLDEKAFDAQNIKCAVAKYEERCRLTEEEYSDSGADYYSDDEEYYNAYTCFQKLQDFFSGLLIIAKSLAQGLDSSFIFDFSAQSQKIANNLFGENNGLFNLTDMFDLSPSEFDDVLSYMREQLDSNTDELDEDDIDIYFLLEASRFVDAYYNKNLLVMNISMDNLLEKLEEMVDELTEDTLTLVFVAILCIVISFNQNHLYGLSITYCEKTLKLHRETSHRQAILFQYILALRKATDYSEKLYAAYDEYLALLEKSVKDFESKDDFFLQKKEILMMYAYDLTCGERIDAAIEVFGSAQKLGKEIVPNSIVVAANIIIENLINNGCFEEMLDFLEEFFPPEYISFLKDNTNEECLNILTDIETYKTVSLYDENNFFNNTQQEYFDYYHDFSRKNNHLLEQKYLKIAQQATNFDFSSLTDQEIKTHASRLKEKAKIKNKLSLAPEAFALVSEAGYRIFGYRHHYVQFLGAAAMSDNKIAEILNGEGKTYTIVLVAFLNYLYDKKVFVVDSSPELTERNCIWMRGLYNLLGMSCALYSESEQIWKKTNDYQEDVIYTTISALGLGFLLSELNPEFEKHFIRYDCAIIDEADCVLVDNAQSLCRITSNIYERTDNLLSMCRAAYALVRNIGCDEYYYSYQKNHITLKPEISPLIETFFGLSYSKLSDSKKIEEAEKLLRAAFLCVYHYEKGIDYHIVNGVPLREHKSTGKFVPFSPCYLEFFISKANGLNTSSIEKTLSTEQIVANLISLRDLFQKFDCICGTTATAVSFKDEFKEIYNLDYFSVPPFAPCIRKDTLSPLYISKDTKEAAIIESVKEKHEKNQPVLLITSEISESEHFSEMLRDSGIPHKLLNAKNCDASPEFIAFSGEPGSVLIATYIANRGVDIKLGGDPEIRTKMELRDLGEDITALPALIYSVQSEKQKESLLYRKYYSILEKNRRLSSKAKQEVIAAGGLCVIGTSFFDEPRNEQQTRGRSGRQGEIGESIMFRSYEDPALICLINQALKNRLFSLVDISEIDYLESPILTKSLKQGQQKIHYANFKNIRIGNDISFYIDRHRKAFIDNHRCLIEKTVQIEDIMHDFATNPVVLSNIKRLQKTTPLTAETHFEQFYLKYKSELKHSSGVFLEKKLSKLLSKEISESIIEDNALKRIAFPHRFRRICLEGLKTYIATVQNIIYNVEMSPKALTAYLDNEKDVIFFDILEHMLTPFSVSEKNV